MVRKLLVLTSFPQKGTTHDSKTVGGASYTKNLLTHLKKLDPELTLEIIGEQLDKKQDEYEEEGLVVRRLWKRNNILSLFAALSYIARSNAPILAVSYEV